MKVFFDTSVLVAACVHDHPHHVQAQPALDRAASGIDQGFMGLHSVAEAYSALTRLTTQPRIHPAEAARIIHTSVIPHLKLVEPGRDAYIAVLDRIAASGWPAAMIDDALLLQCAAQSGAERIYTFNLKHFRQLASPEVLDRICAPV